MIIFTKNSSSTHYRRVFLLLTYWHVPTVASHSYFTKQIFITVIYVKFALLMRVFCQELLNCRPSYSRLHCAKLSRAKFWGNKSLTRLLEISKRSAYSHYNYHFTKKNLFQFFKTAAMLLHMTTKLYWMMMSRYSDF